MNDAMRYQRLCDSGLPLCFEGREYAGKAELDAAIDATLQPYRRKKPLYAAPVQAAPASSPPANPIPAEWAHAAYQCLRRHNSTIPDDVLYAMRDLLLARPHAPAIVQAVSDTWDAARLNFVIQRGMPTMHEPGVWRYSFADQVFSDPRDAIDAALSKPAQADDGEGL